MTSPIQRGRFGRYQSLLLAVCDFVVLNIVLAISRKLIPEMFAEHERTVWLVANLVMLPVTSWLQTSNSHRTIHMQYLLTNTIRGVGLHALLLIAALTFINIEIAWYTYIKFYGLFFTASFIWGIVSRLAIKKYRKGGYNFSRVVIVGTNPTAQRLAKEMTSDATFGYMLMGYFGNQPDSDKFPMQEYKGGLDKLDDFVKEHKVDEIFCTLSGADEENVTKTIHIADENVVKFYYVPQLGRYVTRNFELSSINTLPVMVVRHNPLSRISNRILKRSFDFLVSSVFLLFSPIIFIPIAIAIKISSPGPVFFKQKRTGYKGHEFDCWKFRTMKVNAQADSLQATKNDPRKTRVGNFLRRTSLDELPQFINVWLGQMSIVGPRPHMLKHTKEYSALIEKYMVRHLVKPGITGWAQVNGFRGQTEELWQMEGRVECDVWYIEHWSFLLDLKIMVRTVTNAIEGENNAF